jgi:hypothetical protein
MHVAELVLESSSTDFESFFVKATDQKTSLVVFAASRDKLRQLLEDVNGLPGLYILQAEDSTVYVGKSVDLAMRLKSHRSTDKIRYRRVLVVTRDQGITRYVDYGEAALYVRLRDMGFRLEQTTLASSIDVKRLRLLDLNRAHVAMADDVVDSFLRYAMALGLSKPAVNMPPPPPPPLPPPPPPSSGRFFVTKPNGGQIEGASAAATFALAVAEAGLDRVKVLGWTFAGEELVSLTQSSKYPSASKPVGTYFVMTHSDTKTKVRLLRRLSDELGLGWQVSGPG